MGIDISGFDLLYLTLAVIGYATAATLWIYFSRPVQERENRILTRKSLASGTSNTVVDFFDDVDPVEPAWQKLPGTR